MFLELVLRNLAMVVVKFGQMNCKLTLYLNNNNKYMLLQVEHVTQLFGNVQLIGVYVYNWLGRVGSHVNFNDFFYL